MYNLIKKIFHRLVLLLQRVVNYLVRVDNKLHNNLIEIIDIVADKNLRMKTFHLHNLSLLEGEQLFREIYNTLNASDEYTNFGHTKIIILRAVNQSTVYSLHPNVLIDNNTSFETYYETVKDKIEYIFNAEDYELNIYTLFEMQVFDMSHLSNKDIKISRKALNKRMFSTSCITLKTFKSPTIAPIPVDSHETVATAIGTLDLETININCSVSNKGVQECICISFYNKELGSKLFLIDHNLLLTNSQEAIDNLWKEFFIYLENDISLKHPLITIFIHNLGSFDGYFLYKQLSLFIYNHPIREGDDEGLRMNSDLNCLFDKQNKFISIKYNGMTFKDSYRLFPVSLANLCKITETKGKIESYNIKYNEISFFDNIELLENFINYAKQDSKALYDSLIKLQNIYLEKYKVNIASVFSTSTLSLKIFRINFQKEIIPVLTQIEDAFIRPCSIPNNHILEVQRIQSLLPINYQMN